MKKANLLLSLCLFAAVIHPACASSIRLGEGSMSGPAELGFTLNDLNIKIMYDIQCILSVKYPSPVYKYTVRFDLKNTLQSAGVYFDGKLLQTQQANVYGDQTHNVVYKGVMTGNQGASITLNNIEGNVGQPLLASCSATPSVGTP